MDDPITNFVGITGADERAAHQVLDMCGYDFVQAIQLWFNDEELRRNVNTAATDTSTSPLPSRVPASGSSGTSNTAPRSEPSHQASREVIYIDSDGDDEDDLMIDDAQFGTSGTVHATAIARSTQEEEDEAIARRIQGELYSGDAFDEGIRAPIARTTEMLVAPSDSWSVAHGDDDLEVAVADQLHRRRRTQRQDTTPFGQSIWADSGAASSAAVPGQISRFARLADLFRPPYELMSRLDWDTARAQGKEKKKWILVNLQDMSNFSCQALNRDIWKDDLIQDIVRENFVFLQFEKGNPEAEQYITLYFPGQDHGDPNHYPHVSIIDPRTGEQLKVWSGSPFPSASDFHAQMAEFLSRYSLAANRRNPVVQQKRPERSVDVDRMTEDEMLELAMRNSLVTGGGEPSSMVVDPDELTKMRRDTTVVAGKGKEKAASDLEVDSRQTSNIGPSSDESSAFSWISSTNVHREPENNSQTTTRIQFKHPNGRLIRRFNLDDDVLRIYEWLKAEPLAGREGIEFELKVVPGSRDLMGDLGKTIAEAGLKQGTVMIEFLK